jgi:hypothetical protein
MTTVAMEWQPDGAISLSRARGQQYPVRVRQLSTDERPPTGQVGLAGPVTRFLVVLRRGLKDWRISSLAVVPETRTVAAR